MFELPGLFAKLQQWYVPIYVMFAWLLMPCVLFGLVCPICSCGCFAQFFANDPKGIYATSNLSSRWIFCHGLMSDHIWLKCRIGDFIPFQIFNIGLWCHCPLDNEPLWVFIPFWTFNLGLHQNFSPGIFKQKNWSSGYITLLSIAF